MLGIIMQLKISARLTPQVTNNNHLPSHEKSIIKQKKKERKYKKKRGTRPKPIC